MVTSSTVNSKNHRSVHCGPHIPYTFEVLREDTTEEIGQTIALDIQAKCYSLSSSDSSAELPAANDLLNLVREIYKYQIVTKLEMYLKRRVELVCRTKPARIIPRWAVMKPKFVLDQKFLFALNLTDPSSQPLDPSPS